jgi:hypothetical protein
MTDADVQAERSYFRHLISNGILALILSEVHFYASLPHGEEEIDRTIVVHRSCS